MGGGKAERLLLQVVAYPGFRFTLKLTPETALPLDAFYAFGGKVNDIEDFYEF